MAKSVQITDRTTGKSVWISPIPDPPRFVPPSKTNGLQLVKRPTTPRSLAAANSAKVNRAKKIV